MADQLTLDGAVEKPDPRKLPPSQRWELFKAYNPHVLPEIRSTTVQLLDQGLRVSINRVFEEMRERIHTVGSEWRLDNSLRAPAALDAMATYPDDLADVFETRRRRSEPRELRRV
jgi:hypothetical protein